MKKFLAVAALLAVSAAQAEELRFGDLNYFLKQGQLNAGVDLLAHTEVARVDGDDTEIQAYFFNSHFGYALSDKLNLTLGLDYIYDGQTEIEGASSADTAGLQNPKLGANFRVLNQSDFGYNFDVGAVATLKIADREVPTVTKDGNSLNPLISSYADPRNTMDLSARLGKKWNEANEFYLTGNLAYHMDGEYETAGGDDTDMDSSMDFKLGGFYQYRPVVEFMLTVGLTGTRVGEVDTETAGNEGTITDHIDYQFNFNAKYLITDTFIAKFVFTQDNRSDFDSETDLGDTEVEKRTAKQFGLGVDFLF